MTAFKTVLRLALPHGIVCGVTIPDSPEPVPEAVLERLDPAERELALGLRGYRQVQFAGGRLAARSALKGLGRRPAPVLTDDRGAPTCANGVAISFSHKRTLAIAMVAHASHGSIGVDIEDLLPVRSGVMSRVLHPEELAEVEALEPSRQWTATLLRFSIKEAVYKALAPRLGRYIDFQEAVIRLGTDGDALVRMELGTGTPPSSIEAQYLWLDGRVLSSVRARWDLPGGQ